MRGNDRPASSPPRPRITWFRNSRLSARRCAAGAALVPLNPIYTERELEGILADAMPRVLIFDAARADVVQPLAARLQIAHVIAVTPGDGAMLTADDAAELPELPELPSPDDIAFVQYTGG